MELQSRSSEPSDEGDLDRVHPPIRAIADTLTFRLVRLVAVNDRAGNRWAHREFGLSLNEWRVLGLTHTLEPVRTGRIARLLLMDKGQQSRVVRQLVDKGLIDARQSETDARSVELTTTKSGQELHDRMLAYAAARNEVVVGTLTREECQEFLRLLQKMTEHNEELLDLAESAR